MLQIQCTKKLIKEFKITTQSSSNISKLHSWNANSFYIDDAKCVCLINDLSKFGFIIYNVTDFREQVAVEIRKNLIAIGLSLSQIEGYLDNEFEFTSTSNKRVISKMNALIKFAIHQYNLGDENIDVLNHKLSEFDTIYDVYVKDYFAMQL